MEESFMQKAMFCATIPCSAPLAKLPAKLAELWNVVVLGLFLKYPQRGLIKTSENTAAAVFATVAAEFLFAAVFVLKRFDALRNVFYKTVFRLS